MDYLVNVVPGDFLEIGDESEKNDMHKWRNVRAEVQEFEKRRKC